MDYNFVQNVVICFPEDMDHQSIRQFCGGVGQILGAGSSIKALQNQSAFFSLMMGNDWNKYNLCIILDDLKGNGYASLLSNIRDRNPYLTAVILVPPGCKGSMELADRIRKTEEYNILCMSDWTPANLRERIAVPRTRTEALHYCMLKESQVGGYASAGENEIIVTGNAVDKYDGKKEEKEEEKSKVVKVRYYEGLPIIRVHGNAMLEAEINEAKDEENFGFLKNRGNYNFERKVEDLNYNWYDFELEPEYIAVNKSGLREYFRREGMSLFQSFESGKITPSEFRARVYPLLPKTGMTDEEKDAVIDSFIRDTTSYGVLDVALKHPDVTDVVLKSKDIVSVQIKGKWYRSNISFQNDDEYAFFIGRICTKNRVTMNVRNPEAYFSDITTLENARLRFIGTDGILTETRKPSIHIRKIDKTKCGLEKLVQDKMLTPDQAEFLREQIERGSSMIICGGSGSGKTVLLNNLIEFLPDNIRGVFVQESEELFSYTKYNIEFVHTLNNKGESQVIHDLRDIATGGLLKNTEVFGIGEIKKDEARDFFTASVNAQCLCTTHGKNVFDGLKRIADLAMYSGDYSYETLLKNLCSKKTIVVYLEKYKAKQIAQVIGWDDKAQDILYDVLDFRNEFGYAK